jgi:hypothetical protein
MANPIVLPPEIILGITTIKASGIDPNDFNNAVQELYNRGYGKQGKWIQDHKDLFMQALQDGYVAEGSQVPNSEPVKNVVPPTPSNPGGYEGTATTPPPVPPASDPEDAVTTPEPPVDTGEGFQDTPTGDAAPDDGVAPEEEPADKHRARK